MAQTQPEPWDGSISGSLKRSDKTIFIDYPAELAALHKLWDNYMDGDRGYVGWTIKLRADLDMNNKEFNGHTIGWNDEHKFGGTFDGQGHIIRNLKIEGKNNNRGLFGKIDKGKVMNLKLVNVDIHAGDGDDCHVGAICGQMFNHSTISHCAVVGGRVRAYQKGNDKIGAICGYMTNNNNTVEYCYSDITVEADDQVGGLVGKIEEGDGQKSGIYHCYFSGTVKHYGDEYFGAICGERFSQLMQNCFYLYRNDGVKGTGNQKKYGGSNDPSGAEIKPCTEEELKQPLLFSIYNDKYTLESDQYVYPFDGYPELKVFLRYDVGDSFYVTNAGHMGEERQKPLYCNPREGWRCYGEYRLRRQRDLHTILQRPATAQDRRTRSQCLPRPWRGEHRHHTSCRRFRSHSTAPSGTECLHSERRRITGCRKGQRPL